MVDALALGASGATHGGSSPLLPTSVKNRGESLIRMPRDIQILDANDNDTVNEFKKRSLLERAEKLKAAMKPPQAAVPSKSASRPAQEAEPKKESQTERNQRFTEKTVEQATDIDKFIFAVQELEELVRGESARSKVLILTSVIEKELREYIRSFLVQPNQKNDVLLDNTIHEFEDLIDLAYRLGLISHTFWRDLQIIREVRNDCVDRLENFSFDQGAISSGINLLARSIGEQAFSVMRIGRMSTEYQFSFIARLYIVTLRSLMQSGGKLQEAGKERLYSEI
jgi:hypothetical protein